MKACLRNESEHECALEPISGRPGSWGEEAIAMLDAGFDCDDPILREILEKISRKKIENTITADKIPIPNSRNLYAIADQWGFLAEGEIFCQLSGVNTNSSAILMAIAE